VSNRGGKGAGGKTRGTAEEIASGEIRGMVVRRKKLPLDDCNLALTERKRGIYTDEMAIKDVEGIHRGRDPIK